MTYDVKEKIVFITGGAKGIGLAIVRELLRNGVKAVTIADINAEKAAEAVKKLNQEFGPNRTIFIKTDVTKSEQLAAAFETSLDTWTAVDIVINNAGIAREEEWELEISINCKALVHGTLLGLQYMGKDRGGKGGIIINTASLAGIRPCCVLPIYSGTKHFVMGFSRAIGDSYHYNRTGVRILTMCPGATDTDIFPDAIQSPLSIFPGTGKDLADLVENRMQSVEHVASGLTTLIKEAESGTAWMVTEGKPPCKYDFQ